VSEPKPSRLKFFRRWKIGGKLAFGYGLLGALALLMALASQTGAGNIRRAFETADAQGEQVELMATQIEAALLKARHYENDFLSRWKTEGFQTAYNRYLLPNQASVDELRRTTLELAALIALDADEHNQRLADDLAAMMPQITVYEQELLRAVALIEQRGFEDTGLEGDFRTTIHVVEMRLADQPGLEPLMVTLLQIRRREKDYLLRGEAQYVDLVQALVQQLKQQIAGADLLPAEAAELAGLMDDYLATFNQLVALDAEITKSLKLLGGASDVLEPLVEDIARVGEQEAAEQLAHAQRVTSQTFVLVGSVLLILLLGGAGLAYTLTRQITTPIQSLARTAERIRAGDFSAQARVESEDEIGALAITFNGMTTQLRQTLEGLAQRTQEVEHSHAELQEAYEAIQEKHEKLLASEKMASLGRLATGIAHEINNPLAATRNALSEIGKLASEYQASIGEAEVTPDDHREIAQEMQRAIQLAESAVERATAFVRGIKSQARDLAPRDRVRFNAVPVIQESLLLVSHALRQANCKVKFEPAADLIELYGSPGELAQVVTNLVTNAIDASAEKGGGSILLHLTPKNGNVEFIISDRGEGIPPEVLPKIFDFMFTTKPVGLGTGLGLSIVHNIVTGGFGGTIAVNSRPGQGTTFTLRLPQPTENSPLKPPSSAAGTRAETAR